MRNADKPINPSLGVIADKDVVISEYPSEYTGYQFPGLSKREHTSIELLKGILSAQTAMRATGRKPDDKEIQSYCKEAIKWTDELLKQLEQK